MKAISLTTILCVTYFALTLLPFIPVLSFDYHNHQRILQIGLLFVSSIFFLKTQKGNKILILVPNIKNLFFLFFTMGLISSLYSKETLFSLFYTIHFSLLFLLLTLVFNVESGKETLYFIISTVVIHSILTLVCLLNIFFSILDQTPPNPFVIYQNFINIRFFNQVQIFIIPFLIYFLKNKDFKRTAYFFLTLNFLLMFIGHARGALLTFIAIFIFAQIFSKQQMREYIIALTCLFFGFLIYYTLNLLLSSNEIALETSSSGRLYVWQETISGFNWQHFVIGNGPGVFGFSLEGKPPMSHPHSSIIEIINEWGGLAFIFISTSIYLTAKNTLSHLRTHKGDVISEILFFSFISGLFYSLLSGVHVMPVPQTMLFIIWGLLLARTTKKTIIEFKKWKLIIFTITLALSWFFYGWVALETYKKIDPDTGYIIGPRYWSIAHRL